MARIYGFFTAMRVKWEEDVSVLAQEEGVEEDVIRQRYSIGWTVDGRTGNITYHDDGSGDYIPSNDTIRLEEPVEEHGWADRFWSKTQLYDSRNDVRAAVSCSLDDPQLMAEVDDALNELEGGWIDNGDGTFYAKDTYTPDKEPWTYDYALHLVVKDYGQDGWVERPWTLPEHADYPHEPGTLHDCPVCDRYCFCHAGACLICES